MAAMWWAGMLHLSPDFMALYQQVQQGPDMSILCRAEAGTKVIQPQSGEQAGTPAVDTKIVTIQAFYLWVTGSQPVAGVHQELMFQGKNIKPPILQGREYESRSLSRTVKMLPFPANLPVSRRLMSKPQEETNSTVSIPPHSAWNVCPRTASFPACIPSKSRNLLSFKNNKYGGEIMFSTEQHQFYRSVSGDL